MRHFIQKNPSVLRLGLSYLLPIAIGSILYQSFALSPLYFEGNFWDGVQYYLSTRSIQFAIMLVIETLIIYLLMKTNVFTRLGVWPPKQKSKEKSE